MTDPDQRLRDATVVGWQPPRGELRVQAVLLIDDPANADAVGRDAAAVTATARA